MSVTPDEILAIIRGEAPVELQQRFLAEANEPNSELNRCLRDVERWAMRVLVRDDLRCDDAMAQQSTQVTSPPFRIVNKAAALDVEELDKAGPPTAKDLVAFCQGTASPMISAMVQQALKDPESEVSLILKRLENQS